MPLYSDIHRPLIITTGIVSICCAALIYFSNHRSKPDRSLRRRGAVRHAKPPPQRARNSPVLNEVDNNASCSHIDEQNGDSSHHSQSDIDRSSSEGGLGDILSVPTPSSTVDSVFDPPVNSVGEPAFQAQPSSIPHRPGYPHVTNLSSQELENRELKALLYQIAQEDATNRGLVHRGISCQQCGTRPIRGVRYCCLQCRDYNVCSVCEPIDHHGPTHMFVKIKAPAPFFPSFEKLPPAFPGDGIKSNSCSREQAVKLARNYNLDLGEVEAYYYHFSCYARCKVSRSESLIGFDAFCQALPLFIPGYPSNENYFFKRVFAMYDSDSRGGISFDRVMEVCMTIRSGNKEEEKLELAFQAFDADRDGFITREDLKQLLMSLFQVQNMMAYRVLAEDEGDRREEAVTGPRPLNSYFMNDAEYWDPVDIKYCYQDPERLEGVTSTNVPPIRDTIHSTDIVTGDLIPQLRRKLHWSGVRLRETMSEKEVVAALKGVDPGALAAISTRIHSEHSPAVARPFPEMQPLERDIGANGLSASSSYRRAGSAAVPPVTSNHPDEGGQSPYMSGASLEGGDSTPPVVQVRLPAGDHNGTSTSIHDLNVNSSTLYSVDSLFPGSQPPSEANIDSSFGSGGPVPQTHSQSAGTPTPAQGNVPPIVVTEQFPPVPPSFTFSHPFPDGMAFGNPTWGANLGAQPSHMPEQRHFQPYLAQTVDPRRRAFKNYLSIELPDEDIDFGEDVIGTVVDAAIEDQLDVLFQALELRLLIARRSFHFRNQWRELIDMYLRDHPGLQEECYDEWILAGDWCTNLDLGITTQPTMEQIRQMALDTIFEHRLGYEGRTGRLVPRMNKDQFVRAMTVHADDMRFLVSWLGLVTIL